MIYRIYNPVAISYEYFDEYGEYYPVLPDGADVEERPLTEAQAMQALRTERNLRLVNSDYTQLPDVNLTEAQVEAWRVYRQELRDITENIVWNVTTWPAKP
jgi:hypothetical protein